MNYISVSNFFCIFEKKCFINEIDRDQKKNVFYDEQDKTYTR